MILPDRQLNNVELDRVAKAAGLVLSVRQRARLARAMIEYHDSVAIWQAAPGPKDASYFFPKFAKLIDELR